MACTAFEAMAAATESLSNEVHRKATHNSLWLNAIPRATYLNGTGLTQTTFTVENSQPTDDTETWSAITLSDGTTDDTGACAQTWTDAALGYSSRTYTPNRMSLRGPILCSTDLIFQHNADSFLSAYVDELGKRSRKTWENKLISEYMKFASKAICTGSGTDSALTVDSTIDEIEDVAIALTNADLEQGHLDEAAQLLIHNGATEGDSNGFITLDAEGPVFPLVCSMELSNKIATNNSELRSDLRYGEPNQLLKRLGLPGY